MPRLLRLICIATSTAILVGICGFLTIARPIDFALRGASTFIEEETGGCLELKDVRTELRLPSEIHYAKRVIRTEAVENLTQPSIVSLERRLMPAFGKLDIQNPRCWLRDGSMINGGQSILVQYQKSAASDLDTSTLMFGVSTSLSRMEQALPQMVRWLTGTKAALVVSIRDSDDQERMSKVQALVDAAGIDATLLPDDDHGIDNSDSYHAEKHFSIVKRLYRRRESHHKWFAIIEDDTFFTSLPNLLKALERYDPSKPWYISSMSEDRTAIAQNFAHIVYGSAATLLSAPILDVLYENFDTCAKAGLGGDQLYSDCIYAHTSPPIQLTQLPGLHQLDLHEDASGWYEAGIRPIIGLHHYNSWHHYPVQYGHLVSDVCGSECFLQRYRFNEDIILTNGYSVVQYPDGVDNIDTDRVEGTFPYEGDQFSFSLGALRHKLSGKKKVSWRLEYALKTPDGSVRQFYVKRKAHHVSDDERLKSEVESVLEVEWKN